MVGDHVVKSWSTSQTVVALSTGKAELYGLNRCGASALGLQSLLGDLGISLDVRLHTDATTGKGNCHETWIGQGSSHCREQALATRASGNEGGDQQA